MLADFLHDPKAEWPEQQALTAGANSARDALLTDDERQKLADRISEAEVLIKDFRSALVSEESVNAFSSQLVRESMLDENTRSVINSAGSTAEDCVV